VLRAVGPSGGDQVLVEESLELRHVAERAIATTLDE